MAEIIAIAISCAALIVSSTTAYLTLLRRGTVRMTRPTIIFFGPDGQYSKENHNLKVFLRFLLYSTGKRGHIIESMHVTLHRGETRQTFNVWIYGDDKLARGSGLFVGESGVACNHHFLLPKDGTPFLFVAGEYQLNVYASVVGSQQTIHLHTAQLTISDTAANALKESDTGIYFDWGSESGKYYSHIDRRRAAVPPEEIIGLLANRFLKDESVSSAEKYS